MSASTADPITARRTRGGERHRGRARTADMGAVPGEALSTRAMGERIRREIASAGAP